MPLPPVNYSQTLNDLATNFTKATIVSTSWFWPASTRLYKVKRQQNYPSWAPDFTALPQLGILSAMDLEGMHFRGSATRYSALIQDERFNRAPPHQLPLKGLCIGTVASLSTQYLQHLLLTQRDGGVGALEHDIDAWTICLNFFEYIRFYLHARKTGGETLSHSSETYRDLCEVLEGARPKWDSVGEEQLLLAPGVESLVTTIKEKMAKISSDECLPFWFTMRLLVYLRTSHHRLIFPILALHGAMLFVTIESHICSSYADVEI